MEERKIGRAGLADWCEKLSPSLPAYPSILPLFRSLISYAYYLIHRQRWGWQNEHCRRNSLKLADLGYRTIVISLDAAHSLSDIFDKEKRLADSGEDKLIQINEKLWIQEIDIQQAIIDYWESVHSYMRTLLNQSGLDEIVAEEIAIFPGMEEICALLYINQYVREKAYDVIILDCAPTGESLRFVSIPTTLEWYMNHLFKLERNLVKVARPVVERLSAVQLPRDNYFQNIQDLFDQLNGIDHILTDPKITTVRLVTNPEKVVIKETQRAFMYFCLYGLCIDAVIINRIIPDTVDSPFFEGWKTDATELYQRCLELLFGGPGLESVSV